MSVIDGILLGILQGVAEFLPISSSGHLEVAQHLLNLEEVPLLFDIFLHLATLVAVCLYFRKQIWELLKCFGRWIARKERPAATINDNDLLCGNDKVGRRTIIAVIISTLITGVIGLGTSKLIPDMPIKAVCVGFIITSVLLIVSALIEKRNAKPELAPVYEKRRKDGISPWQAVSVGVLQGFGTLPGVSRSGSTIAGALGSGMDRKVAGEYSFILSIPAILGAFILELKDLGEMTGVIGAAPIIGGCAAAFAVGYISLTLLMKMIRKGKLQWFAAYLIPAGILGIIFL